MRDTRLTRGDWIALAILVGIPLVAFSVPAALGYPLLTGYRGQPPRDTKALLAAMKALATFAGKHPELDQIELNPLLLYEKGLFAVDVRIFSRL